MRPVKHWAVLFFDFDNTVTKEDVLDRVIEQFSISDEWRRWEDAWVRGEISTVQCLERQVAGIRVSEAELVDFVTGFEIDPNFASIVRWASNARVGLFVVSDNFSCLVRKILSHHGLIDVQVMANELTFSGNNPQPHFPFRSAACSRCAHCKAVHFRRFENCRKIFVGDGLSDVCPALAADVVFAKDSLADYLAYRSLPFHRFDSLDVVERLVRASRLSVVDSVRSAQHNTRADTLAGAR